MEDEQQQAAAEPRGENPNVISILIPRRKRRASWARISQPKQVPIVISRPVVRTSGHRFP